MSIHKLHPGAQGQFVQWPTKQTEERDWLISREHVILFTQFLRFSWEIYAPCWAYTWYIKYLHTLFSCQGSTYIILSHIFLPLFFSLVFWSLWLPSSNLLATTHVISTMCKYVSFEAKLKSVYCLMFCPRECPIVTIHHSQNSVRLKFCNHPLVRMVPENHAKHL